MRNADVRRLLLEALRFPSAAIGLLLLTACAPYTRDVNAFTELVTSWELPGKPVQEAKSILEGRGFRVSRIREGNNPSKPELFPEALFATRRGGLVACIIGELEWRIILTIDQERITRIRTFVFEHCL
jgi:hypothetical protein